MSSNVHPNSGPVFSCSVCPGNVTWRGRSVQCSKWAHLRWSLISYSIFKTLGSSHFWSCSPDAFVLLLEIPHLTTLCLPLQTPPACIPPLFNLVHLVPSANAALLTHSRFQTSYLPSAHFEFLPSAPSPPFMLLAVFLHLLLSLPP